MNKASQRELEMAIAWLDLNDDDATEMACRTLATIQRCGTAADTKKKEDEEEEHELPQLGATATHTRLVMCTCCCIGQRCVEAQ